MPGINADAATVTDAAITAATITATIDTARRRSTAGRRRRRNPDLAAAGASIRGRTMATGNKEVGCFGLGGNGGGSECESCHGHDRYLPNFSIMTRLPLIICLPTETSNKAQAGISRPLSRDISQHGESEDRRDFQLLDWPASGPCPVYRRHVTGRGRRVRVTRCNRAASRASWPAASSPGVRFMMIRRLVELGLKAKGK